MLEKRDAWRNEMLGWVKGYDLILSPESWQPAPLIGERREGASGGRTGGNFAALYNHVGWPAGVVRAGVSPEGMPIGIHVIGQPWREDVVLAALQYLEDRTGGWVPPSI